MASLWETCVAVLLLVYSSLVCKLIIIIISDTKPNAFQLIELNKRCIDFYEQLHGSHVTKGLCVQPGSGQEEVPVVK